jgi:hypothetical protein
MASVTAGTIPNLILHKNRKPVCKGVKMYMTITPTH